MRFCRHQAASKRFGSALMNLYAGICKPVEEKRRIISVVQYFACAVRNFPRQPFKVREASWLSPGNARPRKYDKLAISQGVQKRDGKFNPANLDLRAITAVHRCILRPTLPLTMRRKAEAVTGFYPQPLPSRRQNQRCVWTSSSRSVSSPAGWSVMRRLFLISRYGIGNHSTSTEPRRNESLSASASGSNDSTRPTK